MDLLTAGDPVPRRRLLLGLAGISVGGLAVGRLAATPVVAAGVIYFGSNRMYALAA